MRGLNPAGLHGIAVDAVTPYQAEHEIAAAGGQIDQPFAALRPEMSKDVVRVHPGEIRHDEAGIPAACTPGDAFSFENGDGQSKPGGMQRSRETGKAAAHYGKVDV